MLFCVTRSWFGIIVWKSFEKLKLTKTYYGKSNRTQNNHFENSSKDGLHFLFICSYIAHVYAGNQSTTSFNLT